MDEALLGVIAEVLPVRPAAEFREAVLRAVLEAVPADWISLNEVGARPEDTRSIAVPALDDTWLAAFARTADSNPLLAHFRATHDGRPYRFSDVMTEAELHATPIWQQFYAPLGVAFQMAFVLSTSADRVMAIALSRRAGSGEFSEAERELLTAARPYLIQAYRNSIEHDALLTRLDGRPTAPLRDLSPYGLTPREHEVLLLVASGRTNAGAAAELGLQPGTVKTHLERAYRKLGVRGRSEAARALWAGGVEAGRR